MSTVSHMRSLDTIPREIQESIVSFIKRPKTLLRLACTNRYWKTLIIPEHLEYRIICLSSNEYYRPILQHLADNRHLASRIYTVSLDNCDVEDVVNPGDGDVFTKERLEERGRAVLVSYETFPTASLFQQDGNDSMEGLEDKGSALPLVRQALSNMTNLESFNWCFADVCTTGDEGKEITAIFQILAGLASLRSLSVRRVGETIDWPPVSQATFPVSGSWDEWWSQ